MPDCDEVRRREASRNRARLPAICKRENLSDLGHSSNNALDGHGTGHSDRCSKEQFQCQPGECVFAAFVCDGEVDCSNGADEQGCTEYASLFAVEAGFKLASGEEGFADTSAEECAKRCLQSKHCTCNAFSHNAEKNRCLLANRYSADAPYDALLQRRNWNYYKLSGDGGNALNTGCGRVKRPAQTPIEAIRLLGGREADVVEVKINGSWGGVCDDGFSFNEAHVVCRQLGYELGALQAG